jgi:hypothetical protein
MKLLNKIYKFQTQSRTAEENYKSWGTTREEHQKRMLDLIHRQLAQK